MRETRGIQICANCKRQYNRSTKETEGNGKQDYDVCPYCGAVNGFSLKRPCSVNEE